MLNLLYIQAWERHIVHTNACQNIHVKQKTGRKSVDHLILEYGIDLCRENPPVRNFEDNGLPTRPPNY
jgi:hypothetical protein